ncbi:MAG: HAD-IC family P-type ATPase [bacterium]|nr:HAD-IC family P-type ATPase [bacterium]
MAWQDYATLDVLDLCKQKGSNSENGLSTEEAQKRLEQDGRNIISVIHTSAWRIFLRQLKSPFIYMLLVAAILSAVLTNYSEGVMIFLFIAINTALGFFQEYRSEKTAGMLSKLISWRSKVMRDGQEANIPMDELVSGDVVILETGDKIGADARILSVHNFSVDESALTGESEAIYKQAERLSKAAKNISTASNMVFAGTAVVSGRALAMVTVTGKHTEFGRIASLAASTKRVSSFQVGISKFSSFIMKLVLVTLAFILLLNFVIKGGNLNWPELLLFGIALAIGVIPEALPLVMTFSFSKGAANLAKRKVVVKRLSAVEDLGNIEILCSDKTGTLTENKLRVADRYALTPQGKEEALLLGLLASGPDVENDDPFDQAIRLAAGSSGQNWLGDYKVLFESPFDPKFLRNNVLAEKDKKAVFVVRGALEVILPMCPAADAKKIEAWARKQGTLGRRVLALASKKISKLHFDDFSSRFRDQEKKMTFVGLISFSDPVKESTISAVARAAELGIKIKIITGDSAEVAGAVGVEVGLCVRPSEVMLASVFSTLSEEEKLKALEDYNIFARVAPDEKHEIISRLQAKYSVGYLGDGINDAPALKAAGVSLAVDNASDIAREAADIILLENDLNIIIDGIREGRAIFANSIKYIKATLASNFGNFYAVAIASLLINYLPMLPLQILLLNLLSDFPMIAIAGDTVDDEELKTPKRYDTREIIIAALALGVISTIFDFMSFAIFSRISPAALQTNWFIASVLTELVFIFSIRSRRFFLFARRPGKSLLWLTLPAAAMAILIPFTAFGAKYFHFEAPKPIYIVWILGICALYLASTEAFKLIYYRSSKKKNSDVLLQPLLGSK